MIQKVNCQNRKWRILLILSVIFVTLGIYKSEKVDAKEVKEKRKCWKIVDFFYKNVGTYDEIKRTFPLTDITVDSKGLTHIVYFNAKDDMFYYIMEKKRGKWNIPVGEREWSQQEKIEPSWWGMAIFLRLDKKDIPHIVWLKKRLHYTTLRIKEGKKEWEDNVIPSNDGFLRDPVFVLSSEGLPYICLLYTSPSPRD